MTDEFFAPGCSYCEGFLRPDTARLAELWNTPVEESPHFVVVPTLGMLVAGWLLVVSRRHVANVGCLSDQELLELEALEKLVQERVAKIFGPNFLFEHGPVPGRDAAGSCVDHVHMHVVPLNSPAFVHEDRRLAFERLVDRKTLSDLTKSGHAYLYYQDDEGQRWVCVDPGVPSQYLRRVVAARIGKPDLWDWAVWPELQLVRKTLDKLGMMGSGCGERETESRVPAI